MPTEKGIRICRQVWAYASADRHGYTYMPQVRACGNADRYWLMLMPTGMGKRMCPY